MVFNQLRIENFLDNEKNKSLLSIIISVVAHIVAVLTIQNINFSDIETIAPIKESYVDLGYQEFDEPPQIVETKIPVIKDEPETPNEKMDSAPATQEMQDQSSEIAGLQKETQIPQAKTEPISANTTDIPYYKIKPKYPKEALLSGIEGHVLLEVDIQEDGSVENIRINGGEKISTFESEARRAVAKWKYKPFIDETGHPNKKANHLVRVDFKLIEEQSRN